jgi:hypothetical protein
MQCLRTGPILGSALKPFLLGRRQNHDEPPVPTNKVVVGEKGGKASPPPPPPKFAVFHSEIVKNYLDELRPFPSYIVLGQVPHPHAARVGRQSPLHLREKQLAAPQVLKRFAARAVPQPVEGNAELETR